MTKPKSKPIALVTGASSGIGAATALKLVAAGYTVYGTSRRGAQPNESEMFTLLALDVNDDLSVQIAIQTLIENHGKIDLLVNNAGFGIAPAAAEESFMAQAQALFNTNFFGLVRVTQAVLPFMRQQKSGRIINIGSVLGFVPMPYMALYAATKHAVAAYSEALDHEVRMLGIRVSTVEPAYTNTEFEANVVASDQPLLVYESMRNSVNKSVKKAMHNADSPDVVATMIVQAAQDLSPKMTYHPGMAKRVRFLRSVVPAALFSKAIRKDLGLKP